MKTELKKIMLISASMFFAVNFYSCKEEETNDNPIGDINSIQSEQEMEEKIMETIPFFEVEKGDSIPKGIFRNKPLFDDDVEILFSTEKDTQLRAEGVSNGNGCIFDLMTSVRDKNDAPETMSNGGRTYYKIPVDLNEGAGGKWIYLYYTKSDRVGESGFASIGCVYDCIPIINTVGGQDKLGKSFGCGGWTDLNQGAGGYYIYLIGSRSFGLSPAVRDILIISSTKAMVSYQSPWYLVPTDLNKGAGGKYIYLCCKY